jgi:hypothetical protein
VPGRMLFAGAVVLVASGLAVLSIGPADALPVQRAVAVSGHCDRVWFIGARGSGESQTGYDGMGPAVDKMYSVVNADLMANGLGKTAPLAVPYSADSVHVLVPNAQVLFYLKEGEPTLAAAEYVHTSVDKYDASLDQGITETEDAVVTVLASCPNAKIVMAGYSQGAAAVHDAENWLAEHKPGEFSHIAGTLLLGDPDRVPDTQAMTFGTEPSSGEGLRVRLDLVDAHDVPDPGTTAEIANLHDIVANFGIRSLLHISADIKVHTSYAHCSDGKPTCAQTGMIYEPVLTQAANWVASLIPASQPGTWTAAEAPLPANAASEPAAMANGAGVSCPSASFCVAVGSYLDTSGGDDGLLLTWSGGEWTAAQAPLPANAAENPATAYLDSVSCASAAFCVAVGSYADTSGNWDGMLLTWSGGEWTAAQAPVPANALGDPYQYLNAVRCPSASFCAAVGTYYAGQFPALQTLIWSGGAWTAAQAPLPPGALNSFSTALSDDSLSCASASYCVVASSYEDSSANWYGLLLTWSGGVWTAAQAPVPANAQDAPQSGLNGVSCPSASYCLAIGGYTPASGPSDDMLRWSNGTWTADQGPYGPQPGTDLSCPSTSFCVSADYVGDDVDVDQTLIWSGASWLAAAIPLPANASGAVAQVYSVSCPSVSSCVAVGPYATGDTEGSEQGLLLTWSR